MGISYIGKFQPYNLFEILSSCIQLILAYMSLMSDVSIENSDGQVRF